ncbi:MAG: hypothetical protein HKN21_11660 [Candidatus Eisenbacteria bacterium]|uniref:ADP,ATP carrier protein n=1 Tax=Eiseniibacteriota bacterium TaxID=2212470 RepID=A0A7Y2E8Y1_UNCEI|nr:hypothetical protein [Candidatus Eisenbacteria bacterium]
MIKSFAEIRPHERRAVFSAFFTLFGILCAHAVLETARDTLFLSSLPASQLAWVYLGVAFVSILLFFLQNDAGKTQKRALVSWLLASIAITVAFWFSTASGKFVALFGLYVWTGVFATLVVVRFWTLVGDMFSLSQAKRLFSLIGVGSVLGAMVGSALAGFLASRLEARHLLLASSGILFLTALIPVAFLPKVTAPATIAPSRDPGKRLADSLRVIWGDGYLTRVQGILLISTIAVTLVDFIFKSYVSANFEPAQLGQVFGITYFALNILSLMAQIFLVSWLVRSFGVDRVLSVFPALLLGGAVFLLLSGGLVASFLLKLFDGGLRHSLQRTATEVLYVPLATEVRSRVKGVIDVLGQRGGQALASGLILATATLSNSETILAAVLIILCGIWIAIAFDIKKFYLALFRSTLNEVSFRTRLEFPEMDLASLESLMASLNSPVDGEVLAALDLLADQDRAHVIPALILYHPSSVVVAKALEVFTKAGRSDFVPITHRLTEHEDPEIRAATIRTLGWVAPDVALYERFQNDLSPKVRASALIGLISHGAIPAEEGDTRLLTLAGGGTVDEKVAVAQAIRFSPGARFEGVLLVLATSKDEPVLQAVLNAMKEIRSPAFIPSLMEMLPNRRLRRSARECLVSIGVESLDQLQEGLANPHLNRKIRLQLPRTVSLFSPRIAAPILQENLVSLEDGAVRYRIIRALVRLQEENDDVEIDRAAIQRIVDSNLRTAFNLLGWQATLEEGGREDPKRNTEVQELIRDLLHHKEVQARERIFDLLGLIYPGEDVKNIFRGLNSANRKVRDSSAELLENFLEPHQRGPMLALFDDLPLAERHLRGGGYNRPRPRNYEDLMRALLERRGVGIRALVVFHVGELKLRNLRGAIEQLPSDLAGLVSQEVDRTLKLLRN